MDTKSKQIELRKIPTRKLLATIKQDIRKTMKASASPSKQKKS